MWVVYWLLAGLVSGTWLTYFILWEEDKDELNITPNVITGWVVCVLFGYITCFIVFILTLILAAESKKIEKWASKPFKTIKLKKKDDE